MENLDLYTPNGELNYVAYLLADQNSVSIKVAKYSGTDKVNLIENEEYGYCSLVKATERMLDKLAIENRTFTKITGAARRLQKNMIDKSVLREALINAMVHNDYTREVTPVVEIYADRLTITSYGGLVLGLSKEEFFAGRSMIRNRELMRIYRDLELVEQLGSGMNRILQAYSKDVFRFSENFMEVCLEYDAAYMKSLEEGQQVLEETPGGMSEKGSEKIVRLLRSNSQLTIAELPAELGISTRAVERHLKNLHRDGVLRRAGGRKEGHWEVIE